MKFNFRLIVFFFSLTVSGAIFAKGGYVFDRDGIVFLYEKNIYKEKLNVLKKENPIIIQIYKKGKEESPDEITACASSLQECLEITGRYFFDADGKNIIVGDYTDDVYMRSIKGWELHESYPLCPVPGRNGEVNGRGGQCYAAVISRDKKVFVLNGILGNSNGCRPTNKCWIKQQSRFEKIINSIVENN